MILKVTITKYEISTHIESSKGCLGAKVTQRHSRSSVVTKCIKQENCNFS